MPIPLGIIPLLGLGAGAASLPFVGPSISREQKRYDDERARTGSSRTLLGDLGVLGRAIADPGAEGRSAATRYIFGPGNAPSRTVDFTGVPDSTPRSTIPAPSGPGTPDWASIIAAMEGRRPSGGGVSVNRGLFNLYETAEEARMLEREMADIEARRVAGDEALRTGWGNVQSANSAAADKARSMASSAGMAAASIWSDAAQRARNIAAQQAQAVGGFEGRAGIDVSPDAGVADWAGFMESQAPADRALAERRQEILGSDLDWMAGMAGSQAEAYAGDLQRQSGIMSFERAREHNLRVQDRIAEERMTLAQMEMQAQATNASLAAQREQFDPFEQVNNMVGAAAVMGSPDLLAQQLGVTREQAQLMIDNFLKGTTQTVLAATPPK